MIMTFPNKYPNSNINSFANTLFMLFGTLLPTSFVLPALSCRPSVRVLCGHLLLLQYYVECLYMTTELISSISYNQIKRKRMVRQSKSKSKLRDGSPIAPSGVTQKKSYPSRLDNYSNERPNEIELACQTRAPCFPAHKIVQSTQIRDTVKRKIQNPCIESHCCNRKAATNDCQRGIEVNEITCSNSREVVRVLIAQSKSQRKLIRYQQLRNKFKLSKSRSRSRSLTSLASKSKILSKRLTQIQATPQKPEDNALKGIKNSHRVKRFESVKEESSSRPSFRYLVNAPREQKQLFRGSKKKQEAKLEQQMESSIEVVKQSSLFDSPDDKFLEQICLRPQNSDQVNRKHGFDENILDLLDVEHRQLSRAIEKKQRQKKILKDLQKLNKKFPKGFFKL